jgi:DNA polymerase-1
MKILAIDANSILNRAFYGIKLLSTASGEYTNAVYGFLSTYFKICEKENPDAVCACFDVKGLTYRHMEYAAYKAGRRPPAPEFLQQIPLIKEILGYLGVACYELPGYEADDLLGTISRICEETENCTCIVLTGDRDSFQLAGPSTTIKYISTKAGRPTETDYTPELVADTYGVTPEEFIDVKALQGDASDNIPGVAGIGEKTAMQLVSSFGGIDRIYENLDALPIRDSVRAKLRAGEASARMSRRLAEIDRNAPIDVCPCTLTMAQMDRPRLYAILHRLELRNFILRLGLSPEQPETPGSGAARESEPESAETVQPEALAAVLGQVRRAPVYLLWGAQLCWIALRVSGKSYLIRRELVGEEAYRSFLEQLMARDVRKIGHDIKPCYLSLFAQGIPFDGFVFDTAIAAYLMNPTSGRYELAHCASNLLGVELGPNSFDAENAFSPLSDEADARRAAGEYLAAIEGLHGALAKKLAEYEMEKLMYDMELPLVEVLAAMQSVGFRVDAGRLAAYGEQLGRRIAILETQIYELAGGPFNINSPKQLGELIFEKLGVPGGKKTKSGYSTDADAMARVAGYNPIGTLVLEYRQLTKLKSTYADGLEKVIVPTDGRIHSSFNQMVTATGRISSTEPNLQNIPVRTELGAQLRHMFVPAEGCVLVDADYSQIELRVLAHVAADEGMKAAFASGTDIHRATAASVAGITPEEVTPAMRSRAKAVNFGLVYGMSEFSLAAQTGMTRREAHEYIENYFAKYPGVRRYMDEIRMQAKDVGWVSTLAGRRRWLPEIRSTNHNVRAFGERVALNTPIQGTAADIIKLAMVAVYRRLKAEGLHARLILQVHDELIVEAAREEAEAAKRILEEEMTRAMPLDVPLVAEASVGEDWYAAKG